MSDLPPPSGPPAPSGPPPPPSPGGAADPPWPPREPGWRHDFPDPPQAFAVSWTVFDAVGLVLWTIVAQVLVSLVLTPFHDGAGTGSVAFNAVGLTLVEVVTLAGAYGWLRGRHVWSWRVWGPVRPAWRHAAIGVGIGLSGFVLAVILPELLRQAFDIPAPTDRQVALDLVTEGQGVALAALVVVLVVLAPIIEELIFRGLLFQSIRAKLGLWPGLGLSSLTFAFLHLELFDQPIALAALLVLAVWLAAAFHKTGSLVVPIVAHATFNAINVAALLIVVTR